MTQKVEPLNPGFDWQTLRLDTFFPCFGLQKNGMNAIRKYHMTKWFLKNFELCGYTSEHSTHEKEKNYHESTECSQGERRKD
ncbi:MAG: hypothetical protein BA872_06070 [Desulfobacterales bacterium C00003060]|nr:MAG: hypothetical protein BA861_06575 [Desulfobacterales bacterium S3730MH5]OEU81281.1 MAG: hypothetical protein BA872_06070 [Desulfobacterales bacterium C00003060]